MTTVAICEHIRDNNSRCASPALAGRHFCWHHSRLRSTRKSNGKLKIIVGGLDTQNSIELTLAQIIQAVLDDEISTTKANTLIRALRLAHSVVKASYSPEKKELDLPDSMLPMLGEGHVGADVLVCPPESSHEAWKSGVKTGSSHEAWRIGASDDSSHEAWKSGVKTGSSHEAWRSGASAPRCESQEDGASAPVDTPSKFPPRPSTIAPRPSLPPDAFASERSLKNDPDEPILREKRFTPGEIRDYWMQHAEELRDDKDLATKGYIFKSPTWLPLSQDEIKHLKKHLPTPGIIATDRERKSLRRLEFHEANAHYHPLTTDEILSYRHVKPTAYQFE